MHFLFHFGRLLFSEVTILLWITYFGLIEMVRNGRLLEWYSDLEDQCFVNQLHQAVSTFLFQFYFVKFGKLKISQVADPFPLQIDLLQGFLDLNWMPGEVAAILHKPEC